MSSPNKSHPPSHSPSHPPSHTNSDFKTAAVKAKHVLNDPKLAKVEDPQLKKIEDDLKRREQEKLLREKEFSNRMKSFSAKSSRHEDDKRQKSEIKPTEPQQFQKRVTLPAPSQQNLPFEPCKSSPPEIQFRPSRLDKDGTEHRYLPRNDGTDIPHAIKKYRYSGDFDDIVFGPMTYAQNYQWYLRSMDKVQFGMFAITVLIAFLAGITLYVYFIIPRYLNSQNVLIPILFDSGYKSVFVSWIVCAVAFSMMLYGLALMQYPDPAEWGRLKEMRWIPMIIMEVYLVGTLLFYISQVPKVPNEILDMLNKDFAVGGGAKLAPIQKYLGCCGVHSYKDWMMYYKELNHEWHGNLCTDNWELKTKSPKACKVPGSCWVQVDIRNPDRRYIREINTDPCLYWEHVTALSILGVFILILLIIVVGNGVTFWYLRKTIRLAKKKRVEMKPKYRFEEYFQ